MSYELQISGKRARTAGMPALKLWPEMLLASWLMYGYSSFEIIELKFLLVRQVPESKQKTGLFGSFESFSKQLKDFTAESNFLHVESA